MYLHGNRSCLFTCKSGLLILILSVLTADSVHNLWYSATLWQFMTTTYEWKNWGLSLQHFKEIYGFKNHL